MIELYRRPLYRYAALAGVLLALGGAGYAYLSYVAEHSRGADGLPDHRAVRASDLWPRPAAKLYYPGSKVVDTSQSDQSDDPNNPASGPARVETSLTSPVDATALLAWYRDALDKLGFAYTGLSPNQVAGGETDAEWHTGRREYFELKTYAGSRGYRVAYIVTR